MYVSRTVCPIGLTGVRGGCKCGGTCAGCGGRQRRTGMGLFDSADFTTWGIGEWGILAVGAYLVMSLAGDTQRAVKRTRRASRKALASA